MTLKAQNKFSLNLKSVIYNLNTNKPRKRIKGKIDN